MNQTNVIEVVGGENVIVRISASDIRVTLTNQLRDLLSDICGISTGELLRAKVTLGDIFLYPGPFAGDWICVEVSVKTSTRELILQSFYSEALTCDQTFMAQVPLLSEVTPDTTPMEQRNYTLAIYWEGYNEPVYVQESTPYPTCSRKQLQEKLEECK